MHCIQIQFIDILRFAILYSKFIQEILLKKYTVDLKLAPQNIVHWSNHGRQTTIPNRNKTLLSYGVCQKNESVAIHKFIRLCKIYDYYIDSILPR